MIIGIKVIKKLNQSAVAIVASLNGTISRYYSNI